MTFDGRVWRVGLMVVATLGAVGASGCKSKASSDSGADTSAAGEDDPETAPVSAEALPAPNTAPVEADARIWAPVGPPALRVEERGVAPSPNHFWRAGYYGWNGHHHSWYPGRWYRHRVGYEYLGPRWHHWGNRWGYYPGRWHRRS